MSVPFALSAAEEVVTALNDSGVSADLDPALVRVPGVWVQIAGFKVDTMASYRTSLRLQLIVNDGDPRRAMEALIDLAAQVDPIVPVREATARSVLLPDLTRLPGLEVVTSVRTEFDPT